MAKKKRTVTSEVLLVALDEMVRSSNYYQSRQSGKRFYDAEKFPRLLAKYIVQTGRGVRENAYRFGMSPGTLERIIAGGPVSDNMLFRIRAILAGDVAAIAKKAIYPGDWRDATPAAVSAAISDVSDRLLFLKKVVESSNFLNSEDSPIDKIQVIVNCAFGFDHRSIESAVCGQETDVWLLQMVRKARKAFCREGGRKAHCGCHGRRSEHRLAFGTSSWEPKRFDGPR
jgi:hypothetical protein